MVAAGAYRVFHRVNQLLYRPPGTDRYAGSDEMRCEQAGTGSGKAIVQYFKLVFWQFRKKRMESQVSV